MTRIQQSCDNGKALTSRIFPLYCAGPSVFHLKDHGKSEEVDQGIYRIKCEVKKDDSGCNV